MTHRLGHYLFCSSNGNEVIKVPHLSLHLFSANVVYYCPLQEHQFKTFSAQSAQREKNSRQNKIKLAFGLSI